MAATVTIRRWTGDVSNPVKTDITNSNSRANAEDSHTLAGTNNSILIPAVGSNYSFWVSTRLSVDAINGGTIDNIRWFTDGTNNFGTGIQANGSTASNYIQATGIPGQTGTELSKESYTSLKGTPENIFLFTQNSPKQISGSTTKTGDFGDFFVYQLEIQSMAGTGATGQEIFTWRYDDTSA